MHKIDRESFIGMVQEFLREGLNDDDKNKLHSDVITFSTDLVGEAYVSSLTFMRLIFFLEDRLGIEISFSELSGARAVTVGGLYEAHVVATAVGVASSDGLDP